MIVMATLQEADRMGNKNKILIQQQQLELLQSFVTNEKPVVKQAIANFTRARMGTHSTSVSEAQDQIRKVIGELRKLVDRLWSSSEDGRKRVFYIISLLFKFISTSEIEGGILKKKKSSKTERNFNIYYVLKYKELHKII